MYSDFIFSYGRYLDAAWSSRTGLSARRIDRDTRFRWLARFESRQFALVRQRRTPTTWNLLVNHRRRVDHYHPRQKQISLSPCLPRRPSCAHAFNDTGRYQARLEKSSPTGLPIRCLSENNMENPLSIENRDAGSSYEQATGETPWRNGTRARPYTYLPRQRCSSIRDSNHS